VLLLATLWLAQIVRGERGRWPSWILLAVMLVACAGAKSSNLPVLLGAMVLVLVVQVVQKRVRGSVVIASVLTLVALVVTAPFLAGGSAASTIKILALPRYLRGLSHAKMTSLPYLQITAVVVLLALLVLIQYCGVLLAVPLLKDPAALLLLGICLAGAAAMLAISHPSLSQLYFMLGVLPVLDVLIAWGLVHVLHGARLGARHRGHMVAMVLALGLGRVC